MDRVTIDHGLCPYLAAAKVALVDSRVDRKVGQKVELRAEQKVGSKVEKRVGNKAEQKVEKRWVIRIVVVRKVSFLFNKVAKQTRNLQLHSVVLIAAITTMEIRPQLEGVRGVEESVASF